MTKDAKKYTMLTQRRAVYLCIVLLGAKVIIQRFRGRYLPRLDGQWSFVQYYGLIIRGLRRYIEKRSEIKRLS